MKHKRILVVDDDASLRTALRKILEKVGYKVLLAKDAATALDLLLKQDQTVDLILTDYRMPEKNGISFAREVMDRVLESHPPVIVMTAFGDVASYLEAMELGIVQDYINKPVRRDELLVIIDSVLRGHGRKAQQR